MGVYILAKQSQIMSKPPAEALIRRELSTWRAASHTDGEFPALKSLSFKQSQ